LSPDDACIITDLCRTPLAIQSTFACHVDLVNTGCFSVMKCNSVNDNLIESCNLFNVTHPAVYQMGSKSSYGVEQFTGPGCEGVKR
jgi:hypothetical protein